MKQYIRFPRSDGTHSRQAHADLPTGTFEREMGKEGFFGPSAHFHHKHAPTGWASFSGALSPHAYDLNKLPTTGNSPWDATPPEPKFKSFADLLQFSASRLPITLTSADFDFIV